MPRKGFKAITVSEDIYALAEYIVEKYRKKLSEKRIRSITQLIEDAILYYVKNYLNEDLEQIEKEIKVRE